MKRVALIGLLFVMAFSAIGAQTINVLFWDDAYPRALMEMIPEFEKATGYKVNIEILQPPQVFTKTSVAVTKESSDYDLVCVDEGNIPLFAKLFEPYDTWPQGKVYKKTDPKSVTPAMLDVAQWEGKLVGLPVNGNLYVWMTRKDLIENAQYKKDFKAAYKYELGVPKTFKEMLEMGTFFNSKGIASGFGPFNGGPAGVFGEAIFMWEGFGTHFIDFVNGKFKLVVDEKKAVEGMEFYKQLMAISPKGSETMAHNERQAAFAVDPKGVFSMFIWPAQIANYEDPDKSIVAGKIIYSAPPAGPAKRVSIRGTWAANIPLASKNKAPAAEFVYWWTSKEIAMRLIEANTVPARTDALSDPKFAKSKPWLAAIADSMKYATSRPRFAEVAQVQELVKKYWIQGITGAVPCADAVKSIMKETQDVLTKAGY